MKPILFSAFTISLSILSSPIFHCGLNAHESKPTKQTHPSPDKVRQADTAPEHQHPAMPSTKTPPAHLHKHRQIEIPAGQPIPSVQIVVHPDAIKGWNLELKLTNFKFAPERINTTGSITEGHAHLSIDGQKKTRLYGPWYYLSDLQPGRHQITVTLNANGHEDLTHKGQPIQATTVIQVPATR